MKRWTGRMVMVGLVTGSLVATGCFYKEQDEAAGGPHTPIQQKYQPGAAEASQDLGANRQGLDMPDWQDHPTADDEEAWRTPEGGTTEFESVPGVGAPQEAYQTAEDVLAPRADEDAPDVEVPPDEAIGGSGDTEPIQRPEESR